MVRAGQQECGESIAADEWATKGRPNRWTPRDTKVACRAGAFGRLESFKKPNDVMASGVASH